jgi:hypothetical protein
MLGRPARPRTTVVSRSVLLAHPVRSVFEAVNDPRTAPSVDPAVRRWEPDRLPIDVGTRFEIRGRLQWLPIRGRSVVVVWDPPHLAVYESVRPRWPIAMRATHRFQPAADGTRYTWESTIRGRGAIGAAASALLAPLLERTIADQQRTLAGWLDDQPS